MRFSSFGLVVLIVLCLPHPAAATTSQSWRYVAGSGLDGNGVSCGVVLPDVIPFSEGGTCSVTVNGPLVTVSVVDDLAGPISFEYVGYTPGWDSNTECGFSGYVASPATLTVPEGCGNLHVYPAVGSLVGTIHATS